MLCLSILRKTNTKIKANFKRELKEHRKSAQVEIYKIEL